jgi:hypothetical protein
MAPTTAIAVLNPSTCNRRTPKVELLCQKLSAKDSLIGSGTFIQLQSEFPAKSNDIGRGFAVKRKSYSVEQIVAILKQAEVGVPVAELIRQVGISERRFIVGRSTTLGWR